MPSSKLDASTAEASHWKQIAEVLTARNVELERAASRTAHDLKEPLRTVSYYVQLLARACGPKLDDKEKAYLNTILDGTRKMYEQIEARLDTHHHGKTAGNSLC